MIFPKIAPGRDGDHLRLLISLLRGLVKALGEGWALKH